MRHLRQALFIASFQAFCFSAQAAPREFSISGIWAGHLTGGLDLQASRSLAPRLEAAASALVLFQKKSAQVGVVMGPRLIFDVARFVPAVAVMGGLIANDRVRPLIIARTELLTFLRPELGLSVRAGAVWMIGEPIVPIVSLGGFLRN